ncbi:uncharacterized protein BJ171DRAFT_581329 [Polychytrium aggregatum]|uniref:uncharacterized protein n=1 Tax=Polychytrium aggregatum TaxID=110093 RepID=UPI0022FF0C6B|nr:uncharacterized protein BJ171DRAFT_581329 [Polychytrium aggregatum]KAI9205122.1 hypothetical protein BJ171DRAFT_581329 [Polychytrium aggregatum]
MKPAFARLAAPSQTAGASAALRAYSTETKRPEPKEVAKAILDKFPGNNPVSKSGTVLLTASVAAWLVSKEIYIVDHEFFEMLCIFGAYGLWFQGGKDGAFEYFADRKNTIRKVLNEAREDHKAVVQERISHISKLSDVVEVTKGLYQISREIAQLEAEAYELKQTVTFNHEVKSVLDSWVRHEASIREREQKQLAAHVIKQIEASLADPKVQTNILNETVREIEQLLTKRA